MRLIDADKYAERLNLIMTCWNCSPCLSSSEAARAVGNLKVALNELSSMPTIATESSVVHTKWEWIPVNGVVKIKCGNLNCCRLIPAGCSPSDLPYCPYCGSKMDMKN